MKLQTLTPEERAGQLREWEEGRKIERFQILYTVLLSFLTSFFIASAIYAICRHWFGPPFASVCALIAAMVPLAVWLATYLQTWGSYVERLLEDIESKIDGRYPSYYHREDNCSFDRQPLHERLQRIEDILSKSPNAYEMNSRGQ